MRKEERKKEVKGKYKCKQRRRRRETKEFLSTISTSKSKLRTSRRVTYEDGKLILNKYIKVKVRLSLCFSLTEHHAIKAYWGSGGVPPRILHLGTRWRCVVSFTARPLYPQERTPGTHWIGGWVGPRVDLDTGGGEKNSQPPPGLEPPII
jgi:hypothetical protein